jgi:hypothetical protein
MKKKKKKQEKQASCDVILIEQMAVTSEKIYYKSNFSPIS